MPSRGMTGRLPKRLDFATIDVHNYVKPSFKPPLLCTWATALTAKAGSVGGLGNLGNDTYGDCTIAALGHAVMTWTANNGAIVKPSDDDVLTLYDETDTALGLTGGRIMDDVVKFIRTNGCFGEDISFYGRVRFSVPYLKEGIYLGGGLYVGVNLPLSINEQFLNGDDWTVVKGYRGKVGSGGAHCVWVCGYDSERVYLVTWGQLVFASWQWMLKYIDEAFVLISDAWTPNDIAPSNLDIDQIDADLAVIT